jgi:putative membrane protein
MDNGAKSGNLAKGALAGLLGGLAASFVMNHFMSAVALITDRTKPRDADPQRSKQMMTARRERFQQMADPTGEISDAVSRKLFNHPLTEHQQKLAGPIVHYAFGALAGAAYGALVETAPATRVGKGVPFGLALWAAGDELAVPALGLGPKPWNQPLQAHSAMFASHIVYGFALETVRKSVRKSVA